MSCKKREEQHRLIFIILWQSRASDSVHPGAASWPMETDGELRLILLLGLFFFFFFFSFLNFFPAHSGGSGSGQQEAALQRGHCRASAGIVPSYRRWEGTRGAPGSPPGWGHSALSPQHTGAG